MKYTPSLALLALLTLLLNPATSIPLTYQKHAGLHSRHAAQLEERQSYGFGTPTHFAQSVAPEERPNICGTSDCQPDLRIKVRELSAEEKRAKRALRKRATYDGEFITNVEFSPK
jgi:hypothetical protein